MVAERHRILQSRHYPETLGGMAPFCPEGTSTSVRLEKLTSQKAKNDEDS